jgi:hypothetical protein
VLVPCHLLCVYIAVRTCRQTHHRMLKPGWQKGDSIIVSRGVSQLRKPHRQVPQQCCVQPGVGSRPYLRAIVGSTQVPLLTCSPGL